MSNINMPNLQQSNIQNKIEQMKKKIDLLQDRLKKNENSQNQFKNGLMHRKTKKDKERQRIDLFRTKKIQNIIKNMLQNKIEQVKKNYKSTTKYTCTSKKREEII